MTLYELTSDYMRLLELAEDPETDPEVFQDTLEGLSGAIEDKADGYARVIKQLKAEREGLKEEADRLKARYTAIDNSIKRMTEHLTYSMVTVDKRKFKTDLFSFNIQKNPPSVRLNEGIKETELPDEYTKITREANKTAIKEAIENGVNIDFAHIEQTEGVRIR